MMRKKDSSSVSLSERLRIETGRLDEEWIEQANLFWEFSQKYAQIVKAEKELKANLSKKLRDTWIDGKLSATAIRAKLEEIPELIEINYKKHRLEGALEAIKQKKQALENLVQLAKLDWFSVPTVKIHTNKRRGQDE